MPVEYVAHQVATGYSGLTFRDVMERMRPRDMQKALEFFALDADRERAAERSSGDGTNAPPKRSMLHHG